MEKLIINSARFDPKVRHYWLCLWLIIGGLTVFGIVLLPIIALVVWKVSAKILEAMSAELFERTLVVKRGIIFRVEKTIPLDKITDVGLTQGPLMRAFGLYRLDFETAGQSGPGALVSMLGIVDAIAFRTSILEQRDRLAEVQNAKAPEPADQDKLTELLASVRNIERILEERVQAQ